MERSRLMFALLERTGQLKKGISVFHFAPEFGLVARLKPLATRYVTADIEVTQYANSYRDVEIVDLSKDSLSKYASQFDLILHNHVLEHIQCPLDDVLTRLVRCLKPEGKMYFSVPIRQRASTVEDIDFDMSPDERRRLFGQSDHVRMLGDQDALEIFNAAQDASVQAIDEHKYLSDADLEMIRVPKSPGLNGATIFEAMPAPNTASHRRGQRDKKSSRSNVAAPVERRSTSAI